MENNLSLEMLANQIQGLSDKSAEQERIIAEQSSTITKLQGKVLEDQVKEVQPPAVPKDAAKVNGREYKFTVAAFVLPGSDKKYLSEEVATDEALLKTLVKMEGQGILRELV